MFLSIYLDQNKCLKAGHCLEKLKPLKVGVLPPNPRWPPAARAPPQTPRILLIYYCNFEVLTLLLVSHKNIMPPGAGVP